MRYAPGSAIVPQVFFPHFGRIETGPDADVFQHRHLGVVILENWVVASRFICDGWYRQYPLGAGPATWGLRLLTGT
jgi:hypothetical protein